MLYRVLIGFFILLTLAFFPAATPTHATQPRIRCFEQTGHCVSDPILAYWEANGGLSVFGYPITDLRVETFQEDQWTGPVQWFERDRLEDHGAQGVMAGRLGAQLLELQGRAWYTFPKATSVPLECRFFPETEHCLCEPFLSYWTSNGGLERFGYPITEQFSESTGQWTGTVQYFERRRMEYHPEHVQPYTVLLGLLGREVSDLTMVGGPPKEANGCYVLGGPLRATAVTYNYLLGCPVFLRAQLVSSEPPTPRPVPLALQPFERGSMLWYNPLGFDTNSPGIIFVIYFDQSRNALVYQQFQDTWREGQSTGIPEEPPAGLYEPIRGFGKLWSENATVRYTLGWATAPEYGDEGRYQPFERGTMIHRAGSDRVFLFTSNSTVEDVPRTP